MREQQPALVHNLQFCDLQYRNMQYRDARHPDLQSGAQPSHWRRIASSRRLTLFFWIYVSQAVAGSVAGFIVPFLYYFGVL